MTRALLAGLALLLVVAAGPSASNADAGCVIGTRVSLQADEMNDPRVFVWTTADLVDEWRNRTATAYRRAADATFARVGTHAILVAPSRTSATACIGDAVAVRLLDFPFRNHYGYVDSLDLRRGQ
jgi:ABC-type sugar transport system substrate-binding protein